MYAIFQSGGKQHKVSAGDEVRVEKLPGEAGEDVVFDRILLASDGENVHVGSPYLGNVRVKGRIARQGKNKKIVVFKYKRRKGYRNTRGHRQPYTLVRIDDVEMA
ncbi:MAG: 50S ribosomal protein L21 [Thermodesulfobacteriota bacterium]